MYFVTSLRIQVFSTSSYIEKNKETEDNFTGCQEEVKACDVTEHLRPHAWPSNCPPPSWDRTATHKQKREASPSTLPFHYKAEQQTKTSRTSHCYCTVHQLSEESLWSPSLAPCRSMGYEVKTLNLPGSSTPEDYFLLTVYIYPKI